MLNKTYVRWCYLRIDFWKCPPPEHHDAVLGLSYLATSDEWKLDFFQPHETFVEGIQVA